MVFSLIQRNCQKNVLVLTAIIMTSMSNAWSQLPGGSLPPSDVPKYTTPVLIPPVMPKAGIICCEDNNERENCEIDYYEISVRQFSQQILPTSLPPTTLWGYGAVASESEHGLLLHNAPSLTIEAKWDRPVRIKWINDLMDDFGNFLPHLFAVDQTLHWANPPGGIAGRDTRPVFISTPPPYTGPVPIVTHVHGAIGVGDESDGYPEAWYLPDAKNISSGYAKRGTWFDFFANKAKRKFGVEWGPGYAIFQYPNVDRASTNWYHDHTLGMTRLNVYAGPAGFYIIRGGSDDVVLDKRNCLPAKLPGPAPKENDPFPSNITYYEIPLAIQDRSFNKDGSLFYPNSRAFFDGIAGPYIPTTDISPQWNPEFFGNMMIVNGNTWPYQTVEKRRYRYRILNGCDSRFLILDFNQIPGVDVWQIGNEGGFLDTQFNLTKENGNRLLMGPAERADLIVDFTHVPCGNYVLGNVGPDEPYSGGQPGVDFPVADPATTGQIMQFNVVKAKTKDHSTPPQCLLLPPRTRLHRQTKTRHLALLEELSQYFEDAPSETLLGNVTGNPNKAPGIYHKKLWSDSVTENPKIGSIEVWEFYNTTGDAHPIHIHEIIFEVLNRQPIFINEESQEVEVVPGSVPILPFPWETGLKDTVIAYPGEVLRIKARFQNPGRYVWHCHIVEHEDNEMMRPYQIGCEPCDQPGK